MEGMSVRVKLIVGSLVFILMGCSIDLEDNKTRAPHLWDFVCHIVLATLALEQREYMEQAKLCRDVGNRDHFLADSDVTSPRAKRLRYRQQTELSLLKRHQREDRSVPTLWTSEKSPASKRIGNRNASTPSSSKKQGSPQYLVHTVSSALKSCSSRREIYNHASFASGLRTNLWPDSKRAVSATIPQTKMEHYQRPTASSVRKARQKYQPSLAIQSQTPLKMKHSVDKTRFIPGYLSQTVSSATKRRSKSPLSKIKLSTLPLCA